MTTQMSTSLVLELLDTDDLSDEELEVSLWRYDEFVSLGFDTTQALTLARDRHVDLSVGRRLAALGCARRLAFEILH